MNEQTRVALALGAAYMDAINRRNLDGLDSVMVPELVSHMRVGDLHGLPLFKSMIEMAWVAFPGILWVCEDKFATQDRVVLRYHFQAVHRAPFLGIPPTHRMVYVEGLEVSRVENGRITEIWNYTDVMTLAAQLGAPDPLALEF